MLLESELDMLFIFSRFVWLGEGVFFFSLRREMMLFCLLGFRFDGRFFIFRWIEILSSF